MKNDVYEFPGAELAKQGIRGIIFDIDNTLVPYEKAEPDEKLMSYFDELKENGITVALVSNNDASRVELFNKNLGFFAAPNAHKPRGKELKRCIEALGVDKKNLVLIGDQIFTDCLAAHLAGLRCYLVKPIADKKTAFFRFKRFFERPFVRSYKRKERKKYKK